MVQSLFNILPDRYRLAPRVHASVDGDESDELIVPIDSDEYCVQIYDEANDQKLVSVLCLISPGNKKREVQRLLFVKRCIELLRHDISLSIIDLITAQHHNLFAGLVNSLEMHDSQPVYSAQAIYAVTCRTQRRGKHDRFQLDNWFYPMQVGKPLPIIPLWLNDEQVVQFDLEPSYEETCRVLRVK
jgi:hypothetical protein